uniref:Uncharacterized protein n=1 Tax=viral metagenome TaxID=1070528 RepID=A0A6M3XNP6_9ZZZZ
MDGKTLLYRLRNILDEASTGTWIDDKTSYDFLWEAAKQFASRAACLTGSQQFITVAEQENYVLNADYLRLYLMDRNNEYYLKFSNSNGDSFIKFRDYEDIRNANYVRTVDIKVTSITTTATTLQDTGQDFSDWETTPVSTADEALYKVTVTNTIGGEFWGYLGAASTTTNTDDTVAVYTDKSLSSTGWNGGTPSGTASYYKVENVSSQRVPSYFTIRDKQALYTQITGFATSAGAASGGECTLTDTAATFITSEYANPGDTVHNTGDGSDGMVLSISSDTAAKTALFGGTANDWTATTDTYVIQPQGRLEIVFDPPPSTSGDIVRIEYIARPNPVYSDYGVYRFRPHAAEALVKYAGWLYKYRDSEPNFGDKLYMFFDNAVRQEHSNLRPFIKGRKLNVSFKKR